METKLPNPHFSAIISNDKSVSSKYFRVASTRTFSIYLAGGSPVCLVNTLVKFLKLILAWLASRIVSRGSLSRSTIQG